MRRLMTVLLLVSSLLTVSSAAQAQNGRKNAGIGIGIGSVDGISGYYRSSSQNFMQGLLSFHEDDSLVLIGDYLWAFPGVVSEAPWMVPYMGIGALFASVKHRHHYYDEDWNDNKKKGERDRTYTVLGARFPLGLQFWIPKMPLQIAVELDPGMALVPGTDFFLDHMIAFRFVF